MLYVDVGISAILDGEGDPHDMSQPGALDYRSHYGNPYQNPYHNPLSIGQWLMIGAGALAVGGLGYWIYAKYKSTTPIMQATPAANNAANTNPQTRWHHAA